ncbi:jg15569 [Pararge aegeria aegeria]|uniref:Jg15569 protein n=1 Tax=Pararge aegeria aegeria TaxID=348720 RepID=A0A8S4RWL0_9NEOP|nr:jg15569 [Pararge aegeria aegeria]
MLMQTQLLDTGILWGVPNTTVLLLVSSGSLRRAWCLPTSLGVAQRCAYQCGAATPAPWDPNAHPLPELCDPPIALPRWVAKLKWQWATKSDACLAVVFVMLSVTQAGSLASFGVLMLSGAADTRSSIAFRKKKQRAM